MTLKTPTEILEDYPQLKTCWDFRDLGYLLRLRLVQGRKTRRSCLLDEHDVLFIFERYRKPGLLRK